MTSAVQSAPSAAGAGDSSSGLADVIETILDKGLVIDAHVSVAVVGIQILTIDARVVVASVDTYLRFAEAVNRLDLDEKQGQGLPEVVEGTVGAAGKARGKAVGAAGEGIIGKAGEILGEIVGGDEEEKRERQPRRKRREED